MDKRRTDPGNGHEREKLIAELERLRAAIAAMDETVHEGGGTVVSSRPNADIDAVSLPVQPCVMDSPEEAMTNSSGVSDAPPILAVTRLFQGLDADTWRDIAERHQLEGWLPVELSRDSCTNLRE